ncbi:Transposon TX1 uncharacterized 149 kDa protein [Linum perenne]
MGPDKASGPDGLNPGFYQSFWEVIGEAVVWECRRWLGEGDIPNQVQETNVILLPKKNDPECMLDLCPISLCDVRYRLVAKVLANILRRVIPRLINEEQSAFVHGRSIIDNVLVATETLHSMRCRYRAKDGEVAVKIDISKAYDRVEWEYLVYILSCMGFSDRWIAWMKLCISSVRYSVVMNTCTTERFVPERGLRQGCPISPFLFILCAEGLLGLFKRATLRGLVHGVRVCQRAPRVTHLLFADDSFFFSRADISEARCVRQIFETYARASGQLINYNKSGLMFSNSTHPILAAGVKVILGISKKFEGEHYLGVPSLIGRDRKVAFRYLKERVWQRLQ